MSMANPPGKCIFCGGGGLSEHVWSKWMHPYIDADNLDHFRARLTRRRGRTSGVQAHKGYQGGALNVRLYVVCKRRCNNGWMSRLDTAAKPLIKPFLSGSQVALSKEAQKTVATWLAMKAMVTEFSDRNSVVSTQAERTFLMEHKAPPDNWKVWIGRHSSPYWTNQFCRGTLKAVFFSKDGTPLPPADSGFANNTQTITLGFGRMLAVLFSSTLVGITFDPPREAEAHLVRIWPYERGLLWPPLVTLNDLQCNVIATAMDRAWEGRPWAASLK